MKVYKLYGFRIAETSKPNVLEHERVMIQHWTSNGQAEAAGEAAIAQREIQAYTVLPIDVDGQ